jgi:HK97 family phage portal protein
VSFLRKINAALGQTASVGASDSFLTRAISGGKSSAGVYVSESTALAFSAVWACHRILSETLAHPPLTVYQRTKNNGNEHAEDLDIYWALKNEFNDHMTSLVARETVMSHIAGYGNGYFEIQRNKGGEAVQLWPMLPDRTKPVLERGKLRYETRVDSRTVKIGAQNTIHVPGLGFDGYIGYSPIHMARNAIGLGQATEEFGGKYFSNGSKSGGILTYPTALSDNAKKNIQASWDKDDAGLENAHRIKILEEGTKFIPTTIPPNDAQFLETRKFQVIEIARFYRMPLHKMQEMERATFSNIEQQAIEFVIDTMLPWFIRWEQELNRKLWPDPKQRRKYFVKFNLNSLLRGDSVARALFYKSGINDGWMVRNEARELEDMEPLEGLDEPLVPLNMGSAKGDQLPNEKALAILEAARMVGKGEPGALGALQKLVLNGENHV